MFIKLELKFDKIEGQWGYEFNLTKREGMSLTWQKEIDSIYD